MARQWQVISEEEAKLHPLYGNKGWLAVIIVMHVFSLIVGLVMLSYAATTSDVSVDEVSGGNSPAFNFQSLSIVLNTVKTLVMFFLVVTKSVYFRVFMTGSIIASVPMFVASGAYSSAAGVDPVRDLPVLILGCIVWITYFHRSKRVRITYEHKILIPEKR
jgi:hypothetical protein